MPEIRNCFNLTEESFRTEGLGQVRVEDLHGHFAVVLEVLSEIDRSHPTRTDLTLDAVAVGKSSLEAFLLIHPELPDKRGLPVPAQSATSSTMCCGYGGGKEIEVPSHLMPTFR